MGNLNCICSCKGLKGIKRLCRAKSDLKRKPMSFKNNHTASHEGIKTVGVDNLCDFSSNSDLCVCIVTWNMNGQVSYEDIAELVGSSRKFDLFIIGLQEAPRNNILRLLQTALVETHILLGKAIMQSLQLYVFGPKNSDLFIKELQVDKHSIGGLGGLIGRKKGAVAIRINYKDIQMVFISCHLSAHAHKVDERNYECMHISHSLFSKNWNPYARPAHITIWLGDLNYRIHGIDTQPARNLIQKDLHENLTSKDQLLQEAERGHIFNGYCEGTLTFKPTYKYNIGSSNYDTSYKVRVPSWTDRVLFKIEDTQKINATLHSYQSMDDIMSSDHKPVKAHLCLKLNKLSSPMHQQEPRFLSR
nr:type IV inositol polyphosphate 5-phosphatase 11 [Quercus suber]POF19739.1 type iv inositol polyphosphate 5-phosphatase 11 [Quercus suber]